MKKFQKVKLIWIMDPKKTVSDILKEEKKQIEIVDFTRFKVGEGI